jgi:hypothetical protein
MEIVAHWERRAGARNGIQLRFVRELFLAGALRVVDGG